MSTESKVIIQKLKTIFARYGIPEKIVSDNGPQYSSTEFADFVDKYNFIHTCSSPHYAQSNGLAEKCVQTANRSLKKAKIDNQYPFLALLAYRTTPLDIGYSPAELLQGRNLRTLVPSLQNHLLPKKIEPSWFKTKAKKGRTLYKSHYDKGSQIRTPLHKG
jgi:transposase InsO family protein